MGQLVLAVLDPHSHDAQFVVGEVGEALVCGFRRRALIIHSWHGNEDSARAAAHRADHS